MANQTSWSIKVKDNELVYIRLLQPSDRETLEEAFRKLSNETKRLRFFQVNETLSEKELDYLLNLDNSNHVAYCAYIMENNVPKGIGVVRYIRSVKNPSIAEIAITIIDEYQGEGIGKELIKRITEHAKKEGITTYVANAFYFNHIILKMITKYPYKITGSDDGILTIKVDL